jgi:hypothetical protein
MTPAISVMPYPPVKLQSGRNSACHFFSSYGLTGAAPTVPSRNDRSDEGVTWPLCRIMFIIAGTMAVSVIWYRSTKAMNRWASNRGSTYVGQPWRMAEMCEWTVADRWNMGKVRMCLTWKHHVSRGVQNRQGFLSRAHLERLDVRVVEQGS